jgi:hypothetical protein
VLSLLLLLLTGPMAAAPLAAADTSVVLGFERAPGQRYAVELEKVREEYATEAGRLILVDRVRHEWHVEAEVRSRRPGGFSMAWTYRPARAAQPSRLALFEPYTRTLANVRIVFAADSLGRPLFVLNPLWVRSRLAEGVERAAPRVDPLQQPLLAAVTRQAATDEGLRRLVLSDPERLHLLSGMRLTRGAAVSRQADMPNPFGSGRLRARETIRLDSLDADGARAYITWNLTPDTEDLALVVLELLEGFDPGAVQATPAELARRFRVSERGSFVVDVDAGWVLHAAYERRIQAGDRLRVEETTLAEIPPRP